jgi:hypothetical protein
MPHKVCAGDTYTIHPLYKLLRYIGQYKRPRVSAATPTRQIERVNFEVARHHTDIPRPPAP